MNEILGVCFVFDEEKIARKRKDMEKLYDEIETQVAAKSYSELEEGILSKDDFKDTKEKIIERAYYNLEQEIDSETLVRELSGKIEAVFEKEAQRLGLLDDYEKILLKREIKEVLVEKEKQKRLIELLRREKAAKSAEFELEKMLAELESTAAEQELIKSEDFDKALAEKNEQSEENSGTKFSFYCKESQDFVRLYRFVSKNLQKFKDFLKDKKGCLWLEEGLKISLLKKGTIAPTDIKNHKSIAISLFEQRLNEYFSDTKLPYRLLDIFLLDKSLKFRESIKAYRSTRGMSFYEVAFVMDALLEKFAWLGKCMRGFAVQDLKA